MRGSSRTSSPCALELGERRIGDADAPPRPVRRRRHAGARARCSTRARAARRGSPSTAASAIAASSRRSASREPAGLDERRARAGRAGRRARGRPPATSATRALEQRARPRRRRRGRSAACAGGGQPVGRLARERAVVLAGGPELARAAARPARAGSRPISSATRGLRAAASPASRSCSSPRSALRHAGVGGVADQRVGEPEGVLAGEVRAVRPDELLARRGAISARSSASRSSGGSSAAVAPYVEPAALERGVARAPRARAGRGGRCARRARLRCSAAACRLALCADRERAAPGTAGSPRRWPRCARRRRPRARPRARRRAPARPRRRAARAASSALSARGAAQSGRVLEQLGAGEAEQQDRRATRECQRVLDEVEQRGVGPVRVLDHGEQRAVTAAASRIRLTAHAVSPGCAGSSDIPSTPSTLWAMTSTRSSSPSRSRSRPRGPRRPRRG